MIDAMREVTLATSGQITRIHIECGVLNHIGEYLSEENPPHLVVVVSDTNVWPLYGERVRRSLGVRDMTHHSHVVAPGDGSKSLVELERLLNAIAAAGMTRDGMLLAVGGGVVTDLAGFAASIWMRGVAYVNCPTTLEACIDAAIGGKTGINHPSGKNLIGAFHHPRCVAIDPDCLATLDRRDVAAGLAECVKHACIVDPALFAWYEDNADAILNLAPAVTEELIARNVAIKAGVVEQDEREQGRRAILNFGHTLGHAIEQFHQYALRHGEAVSLGMVCATRISQALGGIDRDDADRIEALLLRMGLPISMSGVDCDAILALTQSDKKIRDGRRRWVLLEGIGATQIRDDVPESIIRDALDSIIQ